VEADASEDILGTPDVVAVFHITAVVHEVGVRTFVRVYCGLHIEAQHRVVPDTGGVERVFRLACENHIQEVLAIPRVKAVFAAFGVHHVVAGAILAVEDVRILRDAFGAHSEKFLPVALLLGVCAVQECRFLLPVLLRREFLILYTVFLLHEIGAENALCAAGTVTDERAVAAVLGVEGELASVALKRIAHEVAVLAVIAPVTIHDIAVVHPVDAVHAVLVKVPAADEVAVLVPLAHVAERAVLRLDVGECRAGDLELQIMELLEEGAGKIKVSAIVERIPLVAPPDVRAIHLVRFVRCEHGDGTLPREVTLAPVEHAAVPKAQPVLVPAGEALRRGASHPEFLKERQLLCCVGKLGAADGAGLPAGACAEAGLLHEIPSIQR